MGRTVPFASFGMVGQENKRMNNRTMLPTLRKKTIQLQVIRVQFGLLYKIRESARTWDATKPDA